MILVIDGQGGGIGRSLVEMLKEAFPNEEIGAVGANAIATANMVKGSPSFAVTGENGVIYNCSQADVIVGPIGIALANAMHGEITPAMANAVSSSRAHLVLVPMNHCHAYICGIEEKRITEYLQEAVNIIGQKLELRGAKKC